MPTTFIINRAVDKPLELLGLKGQYIFYAGGLLAGDIVLFALLYICHVNSWICVAVSFGIGGGGLTGLFRLSRKYGVYGLAKRRAATGVPKLIRCHGRQFFTDLNQDHAKVNREHFSYHPGLR